MRSPKCSREKCSTRRNKKALSKETNPQRLTKVKSIRSSRNSRNTKTNRIPLKGRGSLMSKTPLNNMSEPRVLYI